MEEEDGQEPPRALQFTFCRFRGSILLHYPYRNEVGGLISANKKVERGAITNIFIYIRRSLIFAKIFPGLQNIKQKILVSLAVYFTHPDILRRPTRTLSRILDHYLLVPNFIGGGDGRIMHGLVDFLLSYVLFITLSIPTGKNFFILVL